MLSMFGKKYNKDENFAKKQSEMLKQASCYPRKNYPITSFMVYLPAGFPARYLAASIAPFANTALE